jgi:tocopherol cyclase
MKIILKFLIVASCLFSVSAFAQVDEFNTYQWNRANHLKGEGKVDRGDWYEWWFYKFVVPETREAFYFIYGVVNPWDKAGTLKGTAAYLQAGDFKKHKMAEQLFPVEAFTAAYDKTAVSVGSHTATDKRITGAIVENSGEEISWDLSIEKDWAFNAMGWGLNHPKISGIFWYPAQASATMSGWVKYHGRTIRVVSAPGYQDRNWGRSFPTWWTWLTSNTFKNSPGTVLAAGGGKPKIFNQFYFLNGLNIGLRHNGEEYIFRTTDGNKINFEIRWGVWEVVATNHKGEKIEISAYAPPEEFLVLPFRSPQGPIFYDYEALRGAMSVRLSKWSLETRSWVQLAALETTEAGIEWGSPDPNVRRTFSGVIRPD